MKKLLLFSDLHAHEFRNYANTLNGVNSRLWYILNILEQIDALCTKEDIEYVAFLGDLFHLRGSVSVTTFNSVWKKIKKLATNRHLLMIAGNHDYTGGLKDCILEPFSEFATIILEPGLINFAGMKIYAVPYREEYSAFQQADCLLGHFGVAGAKVRDAGYSPAAEVILSALADYELCFLGHYHLHQLLNNVEYIGSPLQLNAGDAGKESGVLILDDDAIGFIPLKSPKFLSGSYKELRSMDITGHYIDVLLDATENPQKRVDALLKQGAESVIFTVIDDYSVAPRLDVNISAPLPQIFTKYVDHIESILPKDKLLQVGVEILTNATTEGNA